MEAPTVEQIAQRLWSEHKYAILARSRDAANEIAHAVATGEKDPHWVVERLVDVMGASESHLDEALDEAWHHLLPRVGTPARTAVEALRHKNLTHARWLVGALAERVGDAVVAASRLFDHPEATRRLWLRDLQGPTMYEVQEGVCVRIAPADVARMLMENFGMSAVRALSLVSRRPRTVAEVREAAGEKGVRALEAAHRLLVLRRYAGMYRPRGEALRVVLAGLGAG